MYSIVEQLLTESNKIVGKRTHMKRRRKTNDKMKNIYIYDDVIAAKPRTGKTKGWDKKQKN